MHFLGIDGGGSRTRALLCDASGQILGHGLSGPTNPRTIPPDDLRQHLLDAIQQAVGGCNPLAIRAAHLGIAGAGEAAAEASLAHIARSFLAGPATAITVGHDLETALEGGLAGAPGIVLLAGTGSACYGRDATARCALCGGWGDLVDDAGSGAWLGLRALQACARQADGRLPPSELMPRVMAFLEIDSMAAFKTRIHSQGLARHERARLAPLVIELATRGDLCAGAILDAAVEELSQLAASVRRQLEWSNPPILLCGGLSEDPSFRGALRRALRTEGFESGASQPRLSAAAGALLLALKSGGEAIGEELIIRLNRSSPNLQ